MTGLTLVTLMTSVSTITAEFAAELLIVGSIIVACSLMGFAIKLIQRAKVKG